MDTRPPTPATVTPTRDSWLRSCSRACLRVGSFPIGVGWIPDPPLTSDVLGLVLGQASRPSRFGMGVLGSTPYYGEAAYGIIHSRARSMAPNVRASYHILCQFTPITHDLGLPFIALLGSSRATCTYASLEISISSVRPCTHQAKRNGPDTP